MPDKMSLGWTVFRTSLPKYLEDGIAQLLMIETRNMTAVMTHEA